ncbi:hypothetical protein ACIQUS_23645 [Pseudomonas sp. NPDC090755]|uniref:hypothetical protein n=1 Tax=Pseudomonas sp. NPDC090755 TaxID=3364481 RepID=UPI00383B3B4C
MNYEFQAFRSFTAQMYWMDPQPINRKYWRKDRSDEQWEVEGIYQRIGVSNRLDNSGWLHVGRPAETLNSTGEGLYVVNVELPRFWFGCYQDDDGRYSYDIRGAQLDSGGSWPFNNSSLEISRNGYLGLYYVFADAGADPLIHRMTLWRLEGFDPSPIFLAEGGFEVGIQLLGPSGKRVGQSGEEMDEGKGVFNYMKEQKGDEGGLALKIIQVGRAQP